MTTTRVLLSIFLVALSLGVTAACGADDDGDAEPSAEATVRADEATRAPEDEQTARPSATPADEDAGSDGEAPTFDDGGWTGGEATVNVSGGDRRTVTGTLSPESSTDGDTTRLIYTNDLDTINFSISREFMPFDMSVSQEGFRARIPADAEPCEVTYTEASESRIEATFRCNARNESDPAGGPLVLEGSFTATR